MTMQPTHYDVTEAELAEYAAAHRSGGRMADRMRTVAAVLLALLWLAPFYYLFISIAKTPAEYAATGPFDLPAAVSPVVDNLGAAWTEARMSHGLLNSLIYGTLGSAIAVLLAALAAHGLSRFTYNGRLFFFMVIFAGTVFPFQMYLIPLFFGYQSLGLIDTRLGMLLLYVAICIPFPTLVLKNYFSQMSTEMDEAARMDGCNELVLFLLIVLPNAWKPIAAMFLLQFTWIWNDLLFSTVLSQSADVRSIMSSLQVFQGAYAATSPTVVLSASLIASIPTLALFLALRKTFMQGIGVSVN